MAPVRRFRLTRILPGHFRSGRHGWAEREVRSLLGVGEQPVGPLELLAVLRKLQWNTGGQGLTVRKATQ